MKTAHTPLSLGLACGVLWDLGVDRVHEGIGVWGVEEVILHRDLQDNPHDGASWWTEGKAQEASP